MKIQDFYPEFEVIRNDSRCTRCRLCERQCANGVHSFDESRRLMLADGDMSNDVGTSLYGSQAVELGLIDRLGTLSDALEALYGMIGKNG